MFNLSWLSSPFESFPSSPTALSGFDPMSVLNLDSMFGGTQKDVRVDDGDGGALAKASLVIVSESEDEVQVDINS